MPYKYKGKLVSSTRIRKNLQSGNINLANKLLSRTWSINGRVIKGKKLGRKLGYRTCNIRIKNFVLSLSGIYAVQLKVKNKRNMLYGVAYLGSRPTFKGKEIYLEIYIFNFNQNLYKKELIVYFIEFIRRDKKFKSPTKLIKQMNKDTILAKKNLKIRLSL